jgi:hypothetical protein
MLYLSVSWFKAASIAIFYFVAQQQPTPPTLAATNAYVRQVDANERLTVKRHIHTYGHAAKPGVDSVFWVFQTDFQGCSIEAYFSGSKVVKLVETARTKTYFTENSYYLQNDQLIFVKNRQVDCPILTQITAWRSNKPPRTKAADYFFRGAYYFAQDSCVSKWERGKSKWEPNYTIPGGGGREVAVPRIFPFQAARYLAVFDKTFVWKK